MPDDDRYRRYVAASSVVRKGEPEATVEPTATSTLWSVAICDVSDATRSTVATEICT
jgi:hypothetical protein